MRSLLIFLFIALFSATAFGVARKTPAEVFVQAKRIESEVKLLLAHEHRSSTVEFVPFEANLRPRHVWQKGYIIQTKLNIYRKNKHWPIWIASGLEPVLVFDPSLVFEHTQLILTELANIKSRLGIHTVTGLPKLIRGKKPIDVFNQLHRVSLLLDRLNQQVISPSAVFPEVMRIYYDTSLIINELKISDRSFPPAKNKDSSPGHNLIAAFDLLKQIQRIQQLGRMEKTDLSSFASVQSPGPTDVYNMVELAIAELQAIKAYLGINQPTPPATDFGLKTPVEVNQLIGWVKNKLLLIQEVRR